MKIVIELDAKIKENEVIIRCNEMSDEIKMVQEAISNALSYQKQIPFYIGDIEYYLKLNDILFFETTDDGVCAHTANKVYLVKYKLYELDDILPGYFLRVSKSAILNTNHIYAIQRNISASSVVEFQNTHKKVFVSRLYYKPLKIKLEEKR